MLPSPEQIESAIDYLTDTVRTKRCDHLWNEDRASLRVRCRACGMEHNLYDGEPPRASQVPL